MSNFDITAVGDLVSRVLVLAAIAFAAWLGLLALFRRVPAPVAGLLAALLSWALASVAAPWVVDALRLHHLWPLV